MTDADKVTKGDGYAVANIADLGDQYGFRKIRHGLDVTAFGINAICLPAGWETGPHFHDEQEEVYFLHEGRIEILFGDGITHVLEPGGVARVDAATVRRIRNPFDTDAVYVIAGGKDGYIGRDGRTPEGETNRAAPIPTP
jgi:mannose-6-phosphate isomerase-like protein (cupin superfamily)